MTDIPSSDRPHDHHAGSAPLQIEARWEKPLVSARGGEATLLVRILAPEQPETTRRAPLDVAFVLDRSGSMSGPKLALAKEGASLAVSRLRDADRAAFVVYDDAVDVVQPLDFTTPRCKASLRVALHGIDAGGSTFLSGGWVAGCQQLADAPAPTGSAAAEARIRRVILLTDGLANAGILDPLDLARHAGELRRRGIATTTVGVGLDFDEGLLSGMAEAGGGNFQYVADPDALRDFFASELQELFSVAASSVKVNLALPPGLDARLVSAFPVETRGSAIDVAIGDLPAGDTIDLVFDIRAGHGDPGSLLPLGVTCEWTDLRADDRGRIDASPPPLRRATERDIAAVDTDDIAAEQAALQRAASERRASLELDRQGRFEESRARMARAQNFLLAAPRTEAVEFDLVAEEDFLAAPANMKYSEHDRKTAQHREYLRRRGRLRRDAANVDGSQ